VLVYLCAWVQNDSLSCTAFYDASCVRQTERQTRPTCDKPASQPHPIARKKVPTFASHTNNKTKCIGAGARANLTDTPATDYG